MDQWRSLVVDEVRSVADEAFQRTVWFGGGDGRWVGSPTEQFCGFFDNASVPEFLARDDHGLNKDQLAELTLLTKMMARLSREGGPDIDRPEYLIDDPRWVSIRQQAKMTLETLSPDPSANL